MKSLRTNKYNYTRKFEYFAHVLSGIIFKPNHNILFPCSSIIHLDIAY